VKKKGKSLTRSEQMRTIKAKNTKPELLVRAMLHSHGFRFRLHSSKLPGKPDIVLPKYQTVIRVMGCFWHGHDCKKGNRFPKTNQEYWISKIDRNKERDQQQKLLFENIDWDVIDIWECDLKDTNWFDKLSKQLFAKLK